MNCKKCGTRIGGGDKAYKEPYHKDCWRRIKDGQFEGTLAAWGYVVGARVEGKGLLTQTSRFGTIIAMRTGAQAHEVVMVEWDDNGIGSYPWNYLKMVTDKAAVEKVGRM